MIWWNIEIVVINTLKLGVLGDYYSFKMLNY